MFGFSINIQPNHLFLHIYLVGFHTCVPYLGLHNVQDFAQILYFVGGVRIINRNNVFHSFPDQEITCPPCFLAHLAKGHVSFCHHLASVRPSVVRRKLSHFNLLIRNHWANCNQTLVEWSMDGPLPKLCPVIPTSNQDGHQAKNRKKGGCNFNCPLLL